MKSFESWTYEDVEIEFNINRNDNISHLINWFETEQNITDLDKMLVAQKSERLRNNVISWNEDELKLFFIGPFLDIVNFTTQNYKPFSQRKITLKTNKIETSGIVDFMIATGKVKPREPFFFLHEYKQQHPSKKNDPLGQLFISMLAAQNLNNNSQPVYGVLVGGRLWYFIVLKDNEYGVSQPLDAGNEDIFQIYAILCKTKDYIDDILKTKK